MNNFSSDLETWSHILRFWFSFHPRSQHDAPNRNTSSANISDVTLRSRNLTLSVTWLHLEIPSMKKMNIIGDKKLCYLQDGVSVRLRRSSNFIFHCLNDIPSSSQQCTISTVYSLMVYQNLLWVDQKSFSKISLTNLAQLKIDTTITVEWSPFLLLSSIYLWLKFRWVEDPRDGSFSQTFTSNNLKCYFKLSGFHALLFIPELFLFENTDTLVHLQLSDFRLCLFVFYKMFFYINCKCKITQAFLNCNACVQ